MTKKLGYRRESKTGGRVLGFSPLDLCITAALQCSNWWTEKPVRAKGTGVNPDRCVRFHQNLTSDVEKGESAGGEEKNKSVRVEAVRE